MEDTLTINGIEYIRKDLRDHPPERGTVWKGPGGRVMVVTIAHTGSRMDDYADMNCGVVALDGPCKGRVFPGMTWSRFYQEHTQEA